MSPECPRGWHCCWLWAAGTSGCVPAPQSPAHPQDCISRWEGAPRAVLGEGASTPQLSWQSQGCSVTQNKGCFQNRSSKAPRPAQDIALLWPPTPVPVLVLSSSSQGWDRAPRVGHDRGGSCQGWLMSGISASNSHSVPQTPIPTPQHQVVFPLPSSLQPLASFMKSSPTPKAEPRSAAKTIMDFFFF